MTKYYVISKDGTQAVRNANFNQIRAPYGLYRCTLVKLTLDMSKKRGFEKREKAEAVAERARLYSGEEFVVVSNKDEHL